MNLLESIEKAGVVGCGGAGFPAHIKWKAKAEYLIVNAVECEPLLLRTSICSDTARRI